MIHSRRATLVLLVACSLLVKLAGVAYMNTHLAWNLVAPDTRGVYQPLGASLAQGHGYQLAGDGARATRVAPGFPFYLAGIYVLGGLDTPTWCLGVLHAVMRAGVTLLVFLLASRAFGWRAGLAAGLVHALDPWEAFWAAFVLKESLGVLLSVAGVVLFARALDRPTWRRGAVAGLVLGLAVLTRYATFGLYPWALVLLAVLGFRRIVPRRGALRLAGALTLGVLAALAPWIVRNYLVLGRATVYTQAAYYFYISNGPGAERGPDTSGYAGFSGADPKAIKTIMPRNKARSFRDATLMGRTAEYLLTRPAMAARLMAARFVNIWRPTFAGSSRANWVVLGLSYCVIMAAALIGLVLGLRRSRSRAPASGTVAPPAPDRLVLYWAVGFYILLHLFFWSEIRYRQYATPYLAAFAGYALSRIGPRATE